MYRTLTQVQIYVDDDDEAYANVSEAVVRELKDLLARRQEGDLMLVTTTSHSKIDRLRQEE